MIRENKKILLKDLCARFPYGVKCQVQEDEFTYIGTLCRLEVDNKNGNLLDFVESISGLDCQVYLSEVKPCLFPLSSMTEEQEKEFYDTFHGFGNYDWTFETYDWLNKKHFDYRGLLEKGLAIDATNLNVY